MSSYSFLHLLALRGMWQGASPSESYALHDPLFTTAINSIGLTS